MRPHLGTVPRVSPAVPTELPAGQSSSVPKLEALFCSDKAVCRRGTVSVRSQLWGSALLLFRETRLRCRGHTPWGTHMLMRGTPASSRGTAFGPVLLTGGSLMSMSFRLFLECDSTCVGCTGQGPGRCKECIPGYTKESGQCTGQCPRVCAGLRWNVAKGPRCGRSREELWGVDHWLSSSCGLSSMRCRSSRWGTEGLSLLAPGCAWGW